jgi:hypothetical protein
MNCDKNGYKYHVWGTSNDSSTWLEQNCTLKNAPSRQLRRVIIDKVFNVDDNALLSDNSGNEIGDDNDDLYSSVVFVPLPDIYLESSDKSVFDALVD